jgi:putative ABC transport system permease protein
MSGEWFRRLWYLLNRRRIERRLQQEMEAHCEMTGEPARFGNTLRLRAESRDVWHWNWLDDLSRDVRYAVRGLRREPLFALTAVVTLALGIATTTTVFSVADAELWRPLPFPDPQQLTAVFSRGPGARAMTDGLSGADLLAWREGAPAFSHLAAAGNTSRQVLRLDTAESVLVSEVTPNYLSTLGRPLVAGAVDAMAMSGGRHAAILTDRAWKRLFKESADAVGRSVTLDSAVVVIAGVVRADDSLGTDPDIFLQIDEGAPGFLDRNATRFYGVIGRLAPGMSAATALAQLQAVESRLTSTLSPARAGHMVNFRDLSDYFTGNNWRPLYFFLGASVVVLLLSGVNVATLLLTRAFRRAPEFALRGALGSSRSALARQLLAEGGMLALCGALIGIALTVWSVRFFSLQLPDEFLRRGRDIPVDLRVCVFVLVVAALLSVVFALAPMIPFRRVDLARSLAPGVRVGSSAAEGRMRRLLLTTQIALTMVLLTAAGLFVKSFVALTQVPLGFEPTNALVVRTTLSGARYADAAAIHSYGEALLEGARVVPGVRLAALASSSPLGSGPVVPFALPGQAPQLAADAARAIIRTVSPGYFETLGIQMRRGREFSGQDVGGAPRVVIVNEYLARGLFGDDNPIGRSIDLLPGARTPWTRQPGAVTIVGVAANVKEIGLNEIEFNDIYVPFAQVPAPWIELIVRASSAATTAAAVRDHVARVDPGIPVTRLATFEERVAGALQGDRFNLLLIAAFAGVAVLLAAVGVYGGVGYNVQARRHEFGVRLALGAYPWRLVVAALWHELRTVLAGGAIGLGAAIALAAAIGDALYLVPGSHNGLLYGVTTTDPAMLAAAFAAVLVVAALAAAIPSHRVSRVDPVSALRNE